MKEAHLVIYASFVFGTAIHAQNRHPLQQPLQANITSVTNILCAPLNTGSATVTAIYGTAPYTYFWEPGFPNTSAVDSDMNAGSYTVMVIDNISDTAYAYVSITQPMPLNIAPAYINNVRCRGDSNGSAAIMANGGVPPYSYLWMPGGNTSTADSNMPGGNYTVTVTDSNGCNANMVLTIGLMSDPTASIAQTNNVSCFGYYNGSAGGLITGGIPPYTYLWTPSGDTTAIAGGLGAGTYTLTATDALGCSTTSKSVITQPLPLILTPHIIDSTAYAIVAGGTPPYTYHWYPPVSTTSLATGLSAGTYTVTVNDSNFCSDSVLFSVTPPPPGPNIYYSLGDTSVTCGDPSYFSFDILVSSDSATMFNNGEVWFKFPAEFAGDDLSNGDIIIERGSDFQYMPDTVNDYDQFSVGQRYDSVDIALGNTGTRSHQGTIVDSIPKVLFHVTLLITNSCQTGTISFADEGHTEFSSDFVREDSVYSYLDSVKSYYDSCCPWHCGDTLGPWYRCGWYCCNVADTNVSGICQDTCWDTCNTYPVYCYVITWHYKKDSVFSYYNYRNVPYSRTYYLDSIPTSSCALTIDYSTPRINAGTNSKSASPDAAVIPPNSSILVIQGTGFGNQKDSIRVSNANNYGLVRLDSVDILVWSENLIKIKMPSVLFNNGGAPGTGPFSIYNACGDSVSAILQINYNITNYHIGNEKYRADIVMKSDTASITFRCDTSISNNPAAYACVKKLYGNGIVQLA